MNFDIKLSPDVAAQVNSACKSMIKSGAIKRATIRAFRQVKDRMNESSLQLAGEVFEHNVATLGRYHRLGPWRFSGE